MTGTDLLDKRLVVVTGKGGVGKSTVAAALGLRAAGRGRRTIVAEIGGRGDARRMFGAGPAGPGERELAPGLFTISIDRQAALEEYLVDQLPARPLASLLGGSRTFGLLTAATPGLSELLCIGKVWELAQPRRRAAGARPYDLVILDAPASGHAVALLAAPRTFARAARVGPIAHQGTRIDATLVDRGLTAVLAVTTPEESAVTETLETAARLAAELGIAPERVVVNGVHPRRFAPRDLAPLRAVLAADPSPAERRAVVLALTDYDRGRSERAQVGRLRRALGEAPVELPFVYAGELGPAELARLGERLEPGS
jgi:anion-transporting  ArsA/GET3 family ATPase